MIIIVLMIISNLQQAKTKDFLMYSYIITDGITIVKTNATSIKEAVEVKNKLESHYNWCIKIIKRKEENE